MADPTDLITDVRNGARPNAARVGTARPINGTNLACNDLTGWPTASKVHFVTYAIDTNFDPIPGTQLDCSGIVSGNTITNLEVIDGVDGGNSVGEVVQMLPTAAWGQDLADALSVAHERTGELKAGAVATSGVLASGVVTAVKIASNAVETAKIADDAVTAPKVSGIAKDNLTTDSNPYKFSVYRAAAQNDGGSTPSIVAFDTENFDTNNDFNTTTGKYTVPVNGFYQFNAGVWRNNKAGGYITLNKNDATMFISSFTDTGSNNSIHVLAPPLMQLTAGDVIEIRAGAEGVVRSLTVGSATCYFGGHLVSRT